MNKLLAMLLACLIFISYAVFAETSPEDEINKGLLLIAQGKSEEVKNKLPEMLAEYPDDAGVQFLLAAVLEDGFKAKDIYEKIVKNYPESSWADDAMWRVLQFHCLVGDTTKSRILLMDFKSKYPGSPFLIAANDIVRATFGIARGKGKKAPIILEEPAEKHEKQAVNIKEHNAKEPQHTENESEDEEESEGDKTPHKTDAEHTEHTKEPKSHEKEVVTYGLQVGAFKEKELADKEMQRFLKNRMRAEVKSKKTKDGSLYVVIIGNYSSMESAEYAKKVVKKECNCEPIIFEKN